MRRAFIPAALLILFSLVLGATVFREQVAQAAAMLSVREQNLDPDGNIKVHEQGSTPVAAEVRGRTTTAISNHICGMEPIVASSMVLSAIGSSVSFEFQTGGACDQNGTYSGGTLVFELDVAANTTVSIPLHDRLPVNYVRHVCDSLATCTASFALVGQAP